MKAPFTRIVIATALTMLCCMAEQRHRYELVAVKPEVLPALLTEAFGKEVALTKGIQLGDFTFVSQGDLTPGEFRFAVAAWLRLRGLDLRDQERITIAPLEEAAHSPSGEGFDERLPATLKAATSSKDELELDFPLLDVWTAVAVLETITGRSTVYGPGIDPGKALANPRLRFKGPVPAVVRLLDARLRDTGVVVQEDRGHLLIVTTSKKPDPTGAGQPATARESKPGNDKPQPESKPAPR